jgi:hypothetical protein
MALHAGLWIAGGAVAALAAGCAGGLPEAAPGAGPGAAPEDAALVLHYRFGQGTGAEVPDASGQGRAARIVGSGQWTDKGLHLDGSGWVSGPHPAALAFGPGGFSVELLVQMDAGPTPEAGYASLLWAAYGTLSLGWGIDLYPDRHANFYARNPQGQYVGVESVALPLGVPLHLVGSRAPDGRVSFYVNGDLQDTLAGATMDYGGARELGLGGGPLFQPSQHFHGLLRDVRLYARCVSGPDDPIVRRGLASATAIQGPPADRRVSASVGVANRWGLCLLDKELRYLRTADGEPPPRPAPVVPDPLHPAVPPVPSPIPSPYTTGVEENVYFSTGGALTANVYQEPGKSWVLHLGIITPNLGDTYEGARTYRTWYRVSTDGGASFGPLKPVILKGDGYDLAHPVDGVRVATNSYAVDETRPIVRASNGEIMVPYGYWPLAPDGGLFRPAHGFTYWDSGVLIGRWTPDGSDVEWTMGAWLGADPKRMPRGLEEPSVVELRQPGEFLLVARGGNDGTDLPGRKWMALSRDYCRTWSRVEPFAYEDGQPLLSPGACSTLLRSRKNGRIYWVGNLAEQPPRANSPRYPLVIGEVDETCHGLIRDSVLVLDTRHPEHDTRHVQLSNYKVYEDPETGHLTVTLSRLDQDDSGNFRGVPCWYQVGVPGAGAVGHPSPGGPPPQPLPAVQ